MLCLFFMIHYPCKQCEQHSVELNLKPKLFFVRLLFSMGFFDCHKRNYWALNRARSQLLFAMEFGSFAKPSKVNIDTIFFFYRRLLDLALSIAFFMIVSRVGSISTYYRLAMNFSRTKNEHYMQQPKWIFTYFEWLKSISDQMSTWWLCHVVAGDVSAKPP